MGPVVFTLLYANENGTIRDATGWNVAVRNGSLIRIPSHYEMIKLPKGTELVYLPMRNPLGFPIAQKDNKYSLVYSNSSPKQKFAVAAILPNGYLRTLLPSYKTQEGAQKLPLFAYTACALKGGAIWVAAKHTDHNKRWEQRVFQVPYLNKVIEKKLAKYPKNQILQQLALCAVKYNCYTAQNTFMERWEGAVLVSPSCNASCEGCLSKSKEHSPPSPQSRIRFRPKMEEILDIAIPHLKFASLPILSFGQGCEGEPTMEASILEEAIKQIRKKTKRGIINVNTNGSKPDALKRLFEAGLDSIRISMNSAVSSWFTRYYHPRNYDLSHIKTAIVFARKMKKFVSINLLVMPGVTDSKEEMKELMFFLKETSPNMIQLRNLNIDPDIYLNKIIKEPVEGIGVVKFLKEINRQFPEMKIGNFTPSLSKR